MFHSLYSSNPSHFPFSLSSRSRHRFSLSHHFIAVSSPFHVNRIVVVRSVPFRSHDDISKDQEADRKTEMINKNMIRPWGNYSFFGFPSWLSWILGLILFMALPYYKKLSMIEDKIKKVETAAEEALEVVEKIAEVTEELCEEVAEKIPVDGELKRVVLKVEEMAEVVDHTAERAETLVKKVHEVMEEIDEEVKKLEKTSLTGSIAGDFPKRKGQTSQTK